MHSLAHAPLQRRAVECALIDSKWLRFIDVLISDLLPFQDHLGLLQSWIVQEDLTTEMVDINVFAAVSHKLL